jgi:hypothetical protein
VLRSASDLYGHAYLLGCCVLAWIRKRGYQGGLWSVDLGQRIRVDQHMGVAALLSSPTASGGLILTQTEDFRVAVCGLGQ